MDELGGLKRKAVYNPTKGLRLNRENERGNYDIKPIANNNGCSWTLFLARYRLDSKRCFTHLITQSRHNTSITRFYFKKSSSSYDTCLLLSFRYFFNEDAIHWMPTSVCVSKLMACDAFSNRESHSHLSFLNVVAVTFNVAVTVKIVVSACCHVECTVNSSRRAALGSIKGQIPATTAVVTSSNPEVTSIVDMEGSVRVFLHKVTVLNEI